MNDLEKLKQDFAERNGKIKLLSQHIKELEAQIEKMKCYLKQYHFDIYEYMQINVIGE